MSLPAPIELQLHAALAPLAARFPGLALRTGPDPLQGPGPALVIWARRLRCTPPARDDATHPHLAARLTATPGPDTHTWLLAGVDEPALHELHTADGQPLIRGDDFTAEPTPAGLRLRLRAATTPIAWVRGPLARGLTTRAACTLKLSLIALAAVPLDADAITDAALQLALPTLTNLAPLERTSFPAALPPGPGVRLRIAALHIALANQQRRFIAGAPGHVAVTTTLKLHGELELEVAATAPEPAARITTIVGQFGGAALTLAGPTRAGP